ncbi:ABC transporter substrate-binding protein [Marinobacter sp.]|uniref:ABC transporter substrate-binding protein n=1 Tax=Marinobacter sp. TaxID=50741 RepID=UPI003562BEAB
MRKPVTRSVVLAAGLATGLLAQLAAAADEVTYQLDWLPGGDKSPIYVGVEKGFFAEEGLEVSIASGRGSTDAITKIATGQADIGSADIAALMAARAEDDSVPVKVVYSIFNQAPHAFFSLAGNGISSVEDIDGKKVATSPFTSSNAFLPLVLKENGLAEDAVALTKADPGALGPMLMNGGTDAIIAWVTNVPLFEDQAEETGNELVVVPWSAAGLELYSSSVVASDRFLSERPDVARRFIKAFDKALRYTNDNPDEAGAALATMVPEVEAEVAAAQVRATMPLVFNEVSNRDGLGALTPGRVAQTWEWTSQAEGLPLDSLDPEVVVDRSLLESLD